MSTQDRRQHPRLWHAARALLKRPDGSQESVVVIDLSLGGALLDCSRPELPGTQLVVHFSEELAVPKDVTATVLRSVSVFGGRRYLLGLRFEVTQPELLRAVEQHKRRSELVGF